MDHGGDMDRAMALYGGKPEDWIDLSTGINRNPYPIPSLSPKAWAALPTRQDMQALCAAAQSYYQTDAAVTPMGGAQAAIQLLPRLQPKGLMRIVCPTYNEYAKVFAQEGWQVEVVAQTEALRGADIAIVVNPNNPDGRLHQKDVLRRLCAEVGLLVVDESFMDVDPHQSVAGENIDNLLVLKSFGKFFGLAGIRLGFALGPESLCERLSQTLGPWPISGAAIEIATCAFSDHAWVQTTRDNLGQLTKTLDGLVPWELVGGTGLFRLYQTDDARFWQAHLAQHRIWVRRFPWSNTLLRLGTPATSEMQAIRSLLGGFGVASIKKG